ncbi:hypothetical protein [Tabrizicola sp.]|uniref:hypothetical protein n=1 Tax=Tabrizicola sp. TaxID=2005166 RepID=UPI002732418C|nr:hypothetical protein [Tabrizicola sp.]MDP3194336.1 hypothetical protein [Tabrizicola sp.]
MKYIQLDRERLIDWLGGRLELREFESDFPKLAGRLSSSEVFVVTPSSLGQATHPVIAVPREGMREFFAFVSTYAANLRPLSAFYHVVSVESLALLLSMEERKTEHLPAVDKLIGVSFAEGFVNAGGRLRSLTELSVQGVKATLSACLLSAILKGYRGELLVDVVDRWSLARRIVGQSPTAVPTEDVLAVWGSLAQAIDKSPEIDQGYGDSSIVRSLGVALRGAPFEAWFPDTIQQTIGVEISISPLKGAREERVRSLPRILEQLFSEKIDRSVSDFFAGGLLSMVGNGSMGHLGLLETVSKSRPRAALWFGALSAFHAQSDILSTANCLGQRVLRDLREVRSVFRVPEGDVQVEELDVLGEKAFGEDGIRTGNSGTLVVGLLGSVSGSFRSPAVRREDALRRAIEEQEAFLIRERARIEELQVLLERAARIAHDIRQPQQRELFERSGTGSKKRR